MNTSRAAVPNGLASCLAVALALSVSGCSNIGYYMQSVTGHVGMLNAAVPISELLSDSATPAPLRAQLAKAQAIRQFASDTLKLPNNASYRRYADLKRPAAVWNIVAAPPFSLQLHTWCFVVAGCVSYRGFYAQADAQKEAKTMRDQGFEVSVYPVPAYSTLGKLNWLGDFGADPLLNTFVNYPDAELARLIFHELAHQVLYVSDDTTFNESFATAVERIGTRQWLAANGTEAMRNAFNSRDVRAQEFRQLTLRTRQRLEEAFAGSKTLNLDIKKPLVIESIGFDATNTGLIDRKAKIMQQLLDEYAQLKTQWGGFNGYDTWIAGANNASLAATGSYDDFVPQFEAVFERQGKDWLKFYDAIKSMVHLSKDARRAALSKAANATNN